MERQETADHLEAADSAAAIRVPNSTYRLQFTAAFGFRDAAAILPYLRELGIDTVYASPIFHARSGSVHGYDVVDPNHFNPELGTAEDFIALSDAARQQGLGWLQDIVPNHMAYDGQNRMLMDVLEYGRASRFADTFDIEWNHPYESLKEKLLAPFLGAFYGECLESGDMQLRYDEAGFSINYYALRLPIKIASYGTILSAGLAALRRRLGGRHPDVLKLLGVLYTLRSLPHEEDPRERADQSAFVKTTLWELYCSSVAIKEFIDSEVASFNGTPHDATSFDALDRLLSEQPYRLSFWKVAAEELNYRRFFNINELISVRVEDPSVMLQTHGLIFAMARERRFTGLRVDHIDGLYDPAAYLARLQQELPGMFNVVEKILAIDEDLPPWPVAGTTGYEFLNYVGGIFCARANKKKFAQIYARFTGQEGSCHQLAFDKKRLIMGKYMAGDIDGLARLLKTISSRDRHAADVTLYGLKRALVEVLTFFPVYRSYVSPTTFSDADRQFIERAIGKAKETNPGLLFELNFIERFLLLRFTNQSEEERKSWTHFVMRFQQLTGPLMAKGFEDTTLYIYGQLLALNDVGGDPDRFGVTVEEFHRFNRRRAERWPHTLNTTATHDSKRGEDARARLFVISELAEEWERHLKRWSRLNRSKKEIQRGQEVPDTNDEYFLYQTLAGAWPCAGEDRAGFLPRLKEYLIKAVREAKVHTEWLKPDLTYEDAYVRFVEAILDSGSEFIGELESWCATLGCHGAINSLAQTVLKIAAPGVPDFYQGSELWDLSFVDPDNRRPVDFFLRRRMLAELKQLEREDPQALLDRLLDNPQDGAIKLYVIYKGLQLRRAEARLFQHGEYLPLRVSGEMAEHICAFARRYDSLWVIAVVPRLLAKSGVQLTGLGHLWHGDELLLPAHASESWCNVFTGETIRTHRTVKGKALSLTQIFARFPVALLRAEVVADTNTLAL
ncbi:MAG TPA: malto-oligosyltrehalose synthase, partial [Candidatus Binatia bacterium]|nr:malto-oligosyltrehalose synthase [Candidatus Binatia bacterium]